MNIILIAEKNHYRDWTGKTYYDILMYYKNTSINNVKIIYSDQCSNFTKNTFIKMSPNIIVFFDTDKLTISDNFNYLFDLKIPIFYCGLDLFYLNSCLTCKNIGKCNGIIHFSKSTYLENTYKYMCPYKKIYHFNARFVNTLRFKNYSIQKKYDILIYGSRGGGACAINNIENHEADIKYKNNYEKYYGKKLGPKHLFYPLRVKIENLLVKNSHKYKLKILDNACIFNAPIANENLSKLINESHLTLACCTRADIAMAKYFEIPASYSAILGDIPSDFDDLFKGNIVEVTEWMSDEEILNIIDKSLEDKEKLWEMTKRLGDRVHSEYNLHEGTKNMDEVFNNIIN